MCLSVLFLRELQALTWKARRSARTRNSASIINTTPADGTVLLMTTVDSLRLFPCLFCSCFFSSCIIASSSPPLINNALITVSYTTTKRMFSASQCSCSTLQTSAKDRLRGKKSNNKHSWDDHRKCQQHQQLHNSWHSFQLSSWWPMHDTLCRTQTRTHTQKYWGDYSHYHVQPKRFMCANLEHTWES